MTHQTEQCIATYISEWDGGFQIETSCVVDSLTGLVIAERSDDPEAEFVDVLEREFVETDAGEQFEVEEVDGDYMIIDLQGFRASFSKKLKDA